MWFVWHDVRDAWRALIRSRGYTIVVVLTLGLGIGVNTAIFTVVDALLLKPLPYPAADRLVRVAEWPRTGGNYTMSPAAFLQWRGDARSFTHFEARVAAAFALLQGGGAEEVQGARVTPGYFDLLGIHPTRGRTFTPDDATPGRPCTVVASHRFWTARLAGDESALGRPLRFSSSTCTLIGVLPANSVFDRGASDLYAPLTFSASDARNNGRMLTVLARLHASVPLEQARTEMVALASAFNATRGEAGRGWTASITPLRDVVIRVDSRSLATVLFGAVVVVLFVACLNVAGLALSRTAGRRREIAIRTALGASRWRLFRYLLIESVLLALSGGVLGVLLGSWGLRTFVSLAPAGTLPAEAAASLDGRALLFTAVLSVATGILFGTVPAMQGTSAPPADALAGSARTVGPSRLTATVHRFLLVVEVSLAMVLLVAAVSLVMSFIRLTRVDPGFSFRQVLTVRLALPAERYPSSDAVARFYDDALAAFRRVPGVVHAGAATSLPLGGWLYGTTFAVHGEATDPERPTAAHIQHATDGYFDALGIPVVAGRSFTPADNARAPLVAIVNETFVKRFVPTGPAVGRQLRLGISAARGDGGLWEIVGVIGDVKTGGLADADLATPEIYVPHQQSPMRSMFVAARAVTANVSQLVPDLRAAVGGIDPELPIGTVMSMDERLGTSVRRERFRTAMISSSAALALLLACLGVYAVRSQAVAARIREMGIRLALGATRGQLLAMVLNQGLRQVVVGLVVGVVAAAWFTRFVEPWLFATRTGDLGVLGGSAALFGTAALLASWLPARRAASIDPVSLLRQE